MSVSKRLLGAYALFSFLVMAAGAIALTFSILWRAPDLLRNLVIKNSDLTAGMVLGILYLVTFALSVGAIVQPVHVTIGLVALNWALIMDSIVTIVIGSIVWFYTLQERANFRDVFSQQSESTRQGLQDMLQCCGYFNSTDLGVSAGFCSDTAKAVNSTPCVDPITASADYTLNNIFSSVYGFIAVLIALFLASMCVIKMREESERFRKIDEKRGGRGFV